MRAVVLVALLSGCYRPSYGDCEVTCASGACPSGLRCEDSMCRVAGATGTCGTVDAQLDDMIDAPLGPFSAPVRLDELSLTTSVDQDPTLTADLLEIIWVSDRPNTTGLSDLWSATRTTPTGLFENITNLTALNSTVEDLHPWLSPDGLTIYFVSKRTGNARIHRSSRATRTSAWNPPSIVNELATTGDEGSMSLTEDQLTIIFDSTQAAPPGRDLYIATRSTATASFGTAQPITELNTPTANENSPAIVGTTELYFVIVGSPEKIHRTVKVGSTWGTPEPLTELDPGGTTFNYADPWVSPDDRTIAFSSSRAGTLDLYISTR